jgi:hypothetical protein
MPLITKSSGALLVFKNNKKTITRHVFLFPYKKPQDRKASAFTCGSAICICPEDNAIASQVELVDK